ncbi:MAG: replication protein [Candidatus Pacebacteria bacterium]|nr:replication protein [Candidatus Paceibacterota bacterium]
MDKFLEKFIGFSSKLKKGEFWMYPRIMDDYWQCLNGSEQKVLDFILRHTLGFGKNTDQISLTQLERGVGKLDKGTGLSRPSIIKAIRGLIDKGFIEKVNTKRTNIYKLVVKENYQFSKNSLPAISKYNLHTIDKSTINNLTKDKASNYELGKRWGEKPFYWGEEMRFSKGKWWVIPNDGGEWLEFAGSIKKDIEWKK